jgi:hypothetical protein
MTNDRDLYDETDNDRDEFEAALTGAHNAALIRAREIMSAPPRLLDPAQEQSMEDAVGDLAAVSRFVKAALRRSWESEPRK